MFNFCLQRLSHCEWRFARQGLLLERQNGLADKRESKLQLALCQPLNDDYRRFQSHELHQADVLAVALNKSAAFAAGVDPRMHAFSSTQFGRKRSDSTRDTAVLTSTQAALRPENEGTTTGEWRPTAMRSAHTHDVRAIVPVNDHLVSAGTDSFLCLTPSQNFKSSNISITPFDSVLSAYYFLTVISQTHSFVHFYFWLRYC